MSEVKDDQELIDPQPKGQAPITGYRKMTEADVDMINRIKAASNALGEVMKELESHPNVDTRWLEAANTNIQTGTMQACRSVAKPNTYA